MEDSKKRTLDADPSDTSKRRKADIQWRTGHKESNGGSDGSQRPGISPGDAGIWATCDRGREGRCVVELRDLFERVAEDLYGEQVNHTGEPNAENEDDGSNDIEAEIQREVHRLKARPKDRLFTAVRLEVPCVVFFKTQSPVNPVDLVHEVCRSAMSKNTNQQTRFVKRLTPVTLVGKAYESDLGELAETVLAPQFHQEDGPSRKFAIRPSIRNHTTLSRDLIIKKVATIVGDGHTVDLKHYDLLILVEVYKNICGIGVVASDYEELKKYNLAELHHSRRLLEGRGLSI